MDTGQPSGEIIDLARLDDATFNRLYKERIEPCFIDNEAGRVAAVASFKRRAVVAVLVAIAAGVLTAMFANEPGGGIVVAFIVGGIGLAIAFDPINKLGRKLKQEYCSAIASAMGATFTMGTFDPPAFARMSDLRLLPGYSRSGFEDLFHGVYKRASFDLYESHLEQKHTDSKGRTRYSTVFRGQLVRLHFPRDFLGVTIVRRDAGVFNAFGGGQADGRKLERVRLVDSTFEKAFEVWGTDQVEARYLLHPVMMERLIDLEKRLKGKRIRCAFENGDLLIAVEGGNLFEPGDLFTPLVDPARARRIVDEIAGVVLVMDQVITAQAERPSAS